MQNHEQLVQTISMKQSDTLSTQYRHIEHLHEEVWCQNKLLFLAVCEPNSGILVEMFPTKISLLSF